MLDEAEQDSLAVELDLSQPEGSRQQLTNGPAALLWGLEALRELGPRPAWGSCSSG